MTREALDSIEPGQRTPVERFWLALVRGIGFGTWAMPMKIDLYRDEETVTDPFSRRTDVKRKIVVGFVGAWVKERSTAESVTVGNYDKLPDLTGANGPYDVAKGLVILRARFAEVVLHELDEQVSFVGKRVFNPHDMLPNPTDSEVHDHVVRELERRPDPMSRFRLPERPRFIQSQASEKIEGTSRWRYNFADHGVPVRLALDGEWAAMDYDSAIIEKARKPKGV